MNENWNTHRKHTSNIENSEKRFSTSKTAKSNNRTKNRLENRLSEDSGSESQRNDRKFHQKEDNFSRKNNSNRRKFNNSRENNRNRTSHQTKQRRKEFSKRICKVTIHGIPLEVEQNQLMDWIRSIAHREFSYANFEFLSENKDRNSKSCVLFTDQFGVDKALKVKGSLFNGNIINVEVSDSSVESYNSSKPRVNIGRPTDFNLPFPKGSYYQIGLNLEFLMNFLNAYYNYFDGDEAETRQGLLEAYANNARLTFIKLKSKNNDFKKTIEKKLNIIHFFINQLPSKHERQMFVMDVHQISSEPPSLFVHITGTLQEIHSKREHNIKFDFIRMFTLIQNNETMFHISSDVFIMSYSKNKCSSKWTQQESCVSTSNCNNNNDALVSKSNELINELKRIYHLSECDADLVMIELGSEYEMVCFRLDLVRQLMKETSLSIQYAIMCCKGANWSYPFALDLFHLKKNELPKEAFIFQ